MNRVFFDGTGGIIQDVSGKKTPQQIKEQYRFPFLPKMVEINENFEWAKWNNGNPIKYNFKEENAQIKAQTDQEYYNNVIKPKEDIAKSILKLDDVQWKNLKEALK